MPVGVRIADVALNGLIVTVDPGCATPQELRRDFAHLLDKQGWGKSAQHGVFRLQINPGLPGSAEPAPPAVIDALYAVQVALSCVVEHAEAQGASVRILADYESFIKNMDWYIYLKFEKSGWIRVMGILEMGQGGEDEFDRAQAILNERVLNYERIRD